jgi:hypothetical protein
MSYRFGLGLALTVLLVSSCDPDPVRVELLAYDRAADAYTFQTVTLETLDDVQSLDGRATTLVGDAEFLYDLRTGIMKWKNAGYSVGFSAVDADGVLVPEDFDSLAMVSIYYGIELSLLYYERIGMPRGTLVHLETYYWPRFKTIYPDGASEIIHDNAYYMYMSPKRRAFFVFPFEKFQWIPMSMNSGIMTHEFSHAVFDELIDEPNRGLIAGMDIPARNFLYGLNEGCADYMAAVRTGDPDFMSHTTPKGIYGIQCNSETWKELVRDVANSVNYLPAFDTTARATDPAEFCPYDVGLFFASTLYGFARALEGMSHYDYYSVPSIETQERVARWLYGAMTELGQTLPLDFELWDMFGLLVARVETEADREVVCDVLALRYSLYFEEVEGC